MNDAKNREGRIIQAYEEDEKAMILVYAQWCINEGLDPFDLYKLAYPDQPENPWLKDLIQQTVPPKEAGHISYETIVNGLGVFGHTDLAFIVQEHVQKEKSQPSKEEDWDKTFY